MTEVSRREKQAGIVPEPDIDTYMKVWSLRIVLFLPCMQQLVYLFLNVSTTWLTGHFDWRVEKISNDRLYNKGNPHYELETQRPSLTYTLTVSFSPLDSWAGYLCWYNRRGCNAKRNFGWSKEKADNRFCKLPTLLQSLPLSSLNSINKNPKTITISLDLLAETTRIECQ